LTYIVGDKKQPEPKDHPLELLPGADPECFICQAAAGPAQRTRYVVHAGELSITILNRYPYNNGHLLVAPRRHIARLDRLTPAEEVETARTITRMIGALENVLHPEGFNVGLNLGRAGGAGLPDHLHWHIVPRWTADTNFMPVLGATNVIPQSLDALWELLSAELRGGL
jgi:ATP adenylyltransferase